MGNATAMKVENLDKHKASGKGFDFREDHGPLTNDCMSLKFRVDNHL